jgi:hypothetical protein
MAKFKKGQSGNPNGKPRGSRNATTILFDELLPHHCLIQTISAAAAGGQ